MAPSLPQQARQAQRAEFLGKFEQDPLKFVYPLAQLAAIDITVYISSVSTQYCLSSLAIFDKDNTAKPPAYISPQRSSLDYIRYLDFMKMHGKPAQLSRNTLSTFGKQTICFCFPVFVWFKKKAPNAYSSKNHKTTDWYLRSWDLSNVDIIYCSYLLYYKLQNDLSKISMIQHGHAYRESIPFAFQNRLYQICY